MSAKSGTASFRAAGSSLGVCASAAGDAATTRALTNANRRLTCAPPRVGRSILLPRRTDLNPPAYDLDLPVGQIGRAVERHPPADDPACSFQFLNQITVVRIAGNDADGPRLLSYWSTDETGIGDVGIHIEATGWIPARAGVALGARRPAEAVAGLEDVRLNRGERRLEIRRRTRYRRQLLVAADRREAGDSQKQSRNRTCGH